MSCRWIKKISNLNSNRGIVETIDAIYKRCSLKTHLSDKPIEPEKLQTILNAACITPLARNTQPWRFVVVQGKGAVEAFVR
jgi:nitroreductase